MKRIAVLCTLVLGISWAQNSPSADLPRFGVYVGVSSPLALLSRNAPTLLPPQYQILLNLILEGPGLFARPTMGVGVRVPAGNGLVRGFVGTQIQSGEWRLKTITTDTLGNPDETIVGPVRYNTTGFTVQAGYQIPMNLGRFALLYGGYLFISYSKMNVDITEIAGTPATFSTNTMQLGAAPSLELQYFIGEHVAIGGETQLLFRYRTMKLSGTLDTDEVSLENSSFAINLQPIASLSLNVYF